MPFPRRAVLVFSAILLFPCLVFAQETEVLIVTPAPAPDGNGTFASFISEPFDPPPDPGYGAVLNDAGQVLFPGYLTGTADPENDYSGLFLYDEGELEQLGRAGQPAPDGDGTLYFFTHLRMPALNSAGTAVYAHLLTDNDSGETFEWGGLVLAPGQEPRYFLREGDPSPDGEGVIQSVFTPTITDSGLIAFGGEFEASDPLGTRGVFRGDLNTGEVTVIAREDQVPPEGNGSFDLMTNGGINEVGQMALYATIDSDVLDDVGLYFVDADDTALRKIIRVGDPVPDSDEVATFFITSGSKSPINEQGQVAFTVVSAECTDCPPSTERLFIDDGGDLTEIARTGGPSPEGGVFTALGRRFDVGTAPALNDLGQVAFAGEVQRDGLIFTGLYRSDGSDAVKIVDNGDPTPSGDGYFLFTSLCCPGFESNDVHKMNERGQVAFFTNLRDTPSVLDREGIFFYDDELGVLKVARTNDELLGSTIRTLRFTGRSSNASDNSNSGLNNLGQVAYSFELADGRSGVALWSPPESTVATEPGNGVPTALAVEASYPNPFRESATLRFALPSADDVELAVYDVLGRRVSVRNLGELEAGTHSVEAVGERLAPGMYVARVTTASGLSSTVRLIKAD